MYLEKIFLQNFRSYEQKKFEFNKQMTIIVGPNTAGKTNLAESIMLLSFGKSLRTQSEEEMIRFGSEVAWIKGKIDETVLEVMIAKGEATAGKFSKKYLVNSVAKSRANFCHFLPAVLFTPEELDIVTLGPSLRREFLDQILEQTDKNYRLSRQNYDRALRQRNALLHMVKETGRRNQEQFGYWDDLLIDNGSLITKKREEFIAFINSEVKDIIDLVLTYDKSVMSEDRLLQYKDAEVEAGMTLVGPQRDDFFAEIKDRSGKWRDVRHFGSRGQQRLVVLQLKILQMKYAQSVLKTEPLLVLDDIFSELDEKHISLVMEKISGGQVIMTTTHKEFISEKFFPESSVIELI